MTKKRQIIVIIISSKVYDIAQVTPIDKAGNLSKSLKNNILFKEKKFNESADAKIIADYLNVNLNHLDRH